MGIRIKLVALLSVALLTQSAVTHAQGTLWEFLGIPQAFNRVNAQRVNRRGNHPKLEKRPPLKRIADPANLESKWAPVKVAAEVKQAEDAAPQKIKAVKYLASIGCASYDKKMDGAVTAALVAAMDDCTESVRLATIKAISEVACDEQCACDKCGQKSCCSEPILMQLAKLAYERDETGCYVEPSEDVRNAAIEALQCCCPGDGELILEGEMPTIPDFDPERGDPGIGVPPPPEVTNVLPPGHAPLVQRVPNQQLPPPVEVLQQVPVHAGLPPVLTPVEGRVERVDLAEDKIYIALDSQLSLTVGSEVDVLHKYVLGQRKVATLKVISSSAGLAIAQAPAPGLTRRIGAGDIVNGWTNARQNEILSGQTEAANRLRPQRNVAADRDSNQVRTVNTGTARLQRTPVSQTSQPEAGSVSGAPIEANALPAARRTISNSLQPSKLLAESSQIASSFVKAVTQHRPSAGAAPRQHRSVPVVSRPATVARPATTARDATSRQRSVVVKQEVAEPSKVAEKSDFVKAVLK